MKVQAPPPPGRSRRFEGALLSLFLAFFVYVAIEARSFATAARLFPEAIAYVGAVLAVLALARLLRPSAASATPAASGFAGDLPSEMEGDGPTAHPLPYLLWTIGYFVTIAIVGFFPATVAFVFTFIVTRPGVRWPRAVAWSSGVVLMAYGLGFLLQLRWPGGLLMRFIGSG